MRRPLEVAGYDALADVYDSQWGFFTRRVLPVIDKLLLARLHSGAHILDLCCGTGQLARSLLDPGYTVTGIDRSRELLRRAKGRAREAHFITADARAFELTRPCDAVVSTFDSLNHLMSPRDFSRMASSVQRALRPGGWFLFDLNMEAGFQSRWAGPPSVTVEVQVVCITQSSYAAVERQGTVHVILFSCGRNES
jgi:SAM-dependent methyltransferase